MTLLKKKFCATIAIVSGVLVLMANVSNANDPGAQMEGQKKCMAKSNRATELAWELKRKKENQCASMPTDHLDVLERMRLDEAKSECFEEIETEFRRSIEDISQVTDECYDAARSL